MRISNDECSYRVNGQVVIHNEGPASFYDPIKTTFNGCDCALYEKSKFNLTLITVSRKLRESFSKFMARSS
jgi:hypothetical protein